MSGKRKARKPVPPVRADHDAEVRRLEGCVTDAAERYLAAEKALRCLAKLTGPGVPVIDGDDRRAELTALLAAEGVSALDVDEWLKKSLSVVWTDAAVVARALAKTSQLQAELDAARDVNDDLRMRLKDAHEATRRMRADRSAEVADVFALRQECGARPHETLRGFVKGVVADRDLLMRQAEDVRTLLDLDKAATQGMVTDRIGHAIAAMRRVAKADSERERLEREQQWGCKELAAVLPGYSDELTFHGCVPVAVAHIKVLEQRIAQETGKVRELLGVEPDDSWMKTIGRIIDLLKDSTDLDLRRNGLVVDVDTLRSALADLAREVGGEFAADATAESLVAVLRDRWNHGLECAKAATVAENSKGYDEAEKAGCRRMFGLWWEALRRRFPALSESLPKTIEDGVGEVATHAASRVYVAERALLGRLAIVLGHGPLDETTGEEVLLQEVSGLKRPLIVSAEGWAESQSNLAQLRNLLDSVSRALAFPQLASPEETLDVYANRVLRERNDFSGRIAAAVPGEPLATAAVVAGVPVLVVRGALSDGSLARLDAACKATDARVVLLELEREPFATACGPGEVPR